MGVIFLQVHKKSRPFCAMGANYALNVKAVRKVESWHDPSIIFAARMRLMFSILFLMLYATVQADEQCQKREESRLIELNIVRLPDLNTARCGHAVLCLDGELTVLGGHTEGFIPTPTAEYLRDGEWHTVSLDYPHDNGLAITLRSGRVLLAGGHKEPLGIGQLFSTELYDPATHTSHGFGCMDRKRAYPNAIEMDSGQVFITGNWYEEDGIEMFSNVEDPACTNATNVKDITLARANPYLLRTAEDDAIIFSSFDNKANPVDCAVVDRLNGPSYREPLLEHWHPKRTADTRRADNHFIGDEAEGRYDWLLPVENDTTGQVAIARVTNGYFSLLATEQPLPDSIHGRRIYYSHLVCDRERGRAFLIGEDQERRIFIASIRYDSSKPSPVTIYYTDPQSFMAGSVTPVLTPQGDLVFAGGKFESNFYPTSTVILLPLGGTEAQSATALPEEKSHAPWLWLIVMLVLAGIAGVVMLVRRKKPRPQKLQKEEQPVSEQPEKEGGTSADLMKQICQLMDEEQSYLNPNLKISDIAMRLGSNTSYVSAAINSQRGCSFSQFLISYRIAYAQELLRNSPDKKILEVAHQSGFNTESSFFRSFKSITSMSPKEWIAAGGTSSAE